MRYYTILSHQDEHQEVVSYHYPIKFNGNGSIFAWTELACSVYSYNMTLVQFPNLMVS